MKPNPWKTKNRGNLTVSSNVTLAKTFTPNLIQPGGISVLTLTLGNPNTVPATLSAAMTDTLPFGVVIANPVGLSGTCTLGGVTAVSGGTTVTYANGASVVAGGCTIKVNVTSSVQGVYTNTIPSGGLQTDRGNNPNPATDVLTVKVPTDTKPTTYEKPTVSKVFNPGVIELGGTSVLTITLGNSNGTPIAIAEAFVDTLPSGMVIGTPSGLSTNCPSAVYATPGSDKIWYSGGAVIPVGGCSISVTVNTGGSGSFTNTIPVCGLNTTVGCNSQLAIATLVVKQPVVVTPSTTKPPITQTDSCEKAYADVTTSLGVPKQVEPGLAVKVSFGFTNKGNIPATGVTYGGSISTVTGFACSGANCSFDKNTGLLTVSGLPTTLAVGETASFALTYSAPDSGTVNVTSSIATKTCQGANVLADSASGSTSTKVNVLVNKPPVGATTTAQLSPTQMECGTSWANTNNSKALNVIISDPIPTGTTYIPGSASCQVSGASTVSKCYYDAANKTVVFEGKIAPDVGGQLAAAKNGVNITFKSSYAKGANCSDNPARAIWDTNGNGVPTDNVEVFASGSSPSTSSAPSTGSDNKTTPVPVFSPLGIIMLVVMMALLGAWEGRRQRRS